MLSEHPLGVVLLAKDLPGSRAFYADALQLPILEENDSAISYSCGSTRLTVTASDTGTKDEQTQASWRVVDLRAELDWLETLGIKPEEYDSDELKTVNGIADRGSVWSAWITDPDGNALGIEQPK
jgi:catechol-2,3-dioxygenase